MHLILLFTTTDKQNDFTRGKVAQHTFFQLLLFKPVEMFYMHNAYFEYAFIGSTVKDSLHIW